MGKAACKRVILHERVLRAYRGVALATGAILPVHARNSRVRSHCLPCASSLKIDSTMPVRAAPCRDLVDPGDANSIQASQVHDPEVLAEMRLPHKDQIAAVTPLDPFVDDRCNVIDVVVMAEKKECFHEGAGRWARLRANESFYMNGCCVPIAGWLSPRVQSCPSTPGIAEFAAIASRAPVP